MNNDFVNVLREIVSEENIILNENMSRHTTFRTGGPASLFISPKDTEQLLKVVEQLRKSDEEYFILGNGSNLLVSDEGYDGAVVSLKNFTDVSAESDTSIRAEGGSLNSAIAAATVPCATEAAVIAGTPTQVVVETVPQAMILRISSSAHFFAILYANSS